MMSTNVLKSLLVLSFLMVSMRSVTSCVTRRCLANEIITKKLCSAPQPPECGININLTSIQYETMSVDTKALHFSSRIKISMQWTDPDLAWTGQYRFKELMLPASKIWTPNLTVDNSVYTVVKPVSKDILVRNDGTVSYAIVMYITVVCGINLFTYPFVYDTCPVSINGWNKSSCGLNLSFGQISPVGGSRGEWKTLSVALQDKHHSFLEVTVSLNPFNALVSLVLPSILIMLSDLVSFSLPLDGERNAFKIKLVFSFTVFLLLLCKHLPDGGKCSPLIYYHYCFSLVVLVVSVLLSMTLTQLSKNGTILPNIPEMLCGSSKAQQDSSKNTELNIGTGLPTKEASVQRISAYMENMYNEAREKKRRMDYADYWNKICFWTYLCLDIIYALSLFAVIKMKYCSINNLEFIGL